MGSRNTEKFQRVLSLYLFISCWLLSSADKQSLFNCEAPTIWLEDGMVGASFVVHVRSRMNCQLIVREALFLSVCLRGQNNSDK